MIIPVPLGKHRLEERGYNQVAMIAIPLAMVLNVKYAPNELTRHKETRSQVELNRQERKKMLKGAFQAGARVKGKNMLALDDVSTTGSTLSSSAEVLYSSDAKKYAR